MAIKNYYFQKLTPVSNANIDVYEEAINFIFDNTDVKNVAISGPYSAGKSSMLETYKTKHKKYRFIHLSLAHFRTSEQENYESEENVKESVLEGKILNQLIHQIPAKRIPQTNFRVKKDVSMKYLILLTAFASMFIWSIIFLFSLTKVTTFVTALSDNWIKTILSILFSKYTTIPATLICATCTVIFIYFLIKAQKNKNIFRKISLQGNEIEIFEEQEDSYFDKYLNEVLYLFENVEADVIVFEDMDRFNANRIFERLREVNTLVNIQRKKENGDNYKPLRFFYLLRDDIFISKDRTKFFDYIIPIVPVVDSSNSYEQFLKHLKMGNLLDKFDQSFLQSLSLYIDDMRILKNIYNEFVVYFHRLNTTELDRNKMMAMIAYKNLFPRDFSDLQLARGFVFCLFEEKQNLIKKALETAKEKRQDVLDRIAKAKLETLTSKQEIEDVYVAKKQRLPRSYGNLTQESQKKIVEYDSEMLNRIQALQDRLDDNLSQLEVELSDTDRDISLTQTKPLQDLIKRDNIDIIFAISRTNEIGEINEFKEIKGNDYFSLLKFLIRSGYIDETYTDYMTYFYDDSISANDKTFLRRITDRRGADYTYVLREPRKVIESSVLRVVEFQQEETLNFDLFECLLLNHDISKYEIYLNTLIAQINETKNFEFVSKFYDADKARTQFVERMNEQWSDFFSLVLKSKTMTMSQIRKYSLDSLYYSNEETIIAVNVNNCMTEYISQCPDYLKIDLPDVDKLVTRLLLIGVSFATIDYESSNKDLFEEVYRHSLYNLSFENISMMLKKEYRIESEYDIIHRNYTLVVSQSDSPLARYISENISIYMKIIISNCDGIISDDENVIYSLLNNADLATDIKKQYIELLTTVIADITQVVDPNLWVIMIKQRIVIFSERNFINYFEKHGVDEVLTEYINNAHSDVNFTFTAAEYGNEIAERLFDELVICNGITTEKYEKVLVDLGYYFDNFNADEIIDEKLDVLIYKRILQMTSESLEFVRKNYEKHLYTFISKNLDEYLALQSTEIFSLVEAMQIILWNISDEQKLELLAYASEQISIVGKEYSDIVNAYIISHNFEEEDKSFLYENYMKYGENARTAIATLATSRVTEIIANDMVLDDNLLSILMKSDVVPRNQKITLFTISIPTLNEDTCKTHFDELELSELKGIFVKGSGRRNYEKSEEVTTIMDALKLNGWIYEYRDDERNNERYVIVKNRPQSKEPEFLD